MNIRINTLFEKYNVSNKNRYEIEQIYSIMPAYKQKQLLNNFELFLTKFKYIEDTINTEKEILLWDSVERIRNSILKNRKNKIDEHIKNEINLLKGEL